MGDELEAIADGIWALRQPIPRGTMPYTFCYLLADAAEDLHLIDPGWDDDANWARLGGALSSIGRRPEDIATVLATHLHADHLGLAARIRSVSGATVQVSATERSALGELGGPRERERWAARIAGWGVPEAVRDDLLAVAPAPRAELTVDAGLADGDLLDLPGREVRVIATPGHTAGSICLRVPAERLLFTGDHVLPDTASGLGLGALSESNPVVDFLRSLERVAVYDDHEVLPGHEHRMRGLARRCAELADRQAARSGEVVAALRELGPGATVWGIASRLTWSAGWVNLHGSHLRSALAQTQWHAEAVASAGAAPAS